MKFFHPQLQLARETRLDEPDAFYLHVVTFCPRTCFRADGHQVDLDGLAEGVCRVRLRLLQDTALPDFPYITPVVHTIALGSIAFPGGEGIFEVQVVGDVIDTSSGWTRDADPPSTKTKTGGKGTVGSTAADGDTKPIDPDQL